MPSTMPLRIGDELLTSARAAAEAAGRSAAQQIGYWAKLGRELERSRSVSVREVAEVLAGARPYDDLDARAQAVVRAEWSERIATGLADLDLAADFAAEGRSWVELAPDGSTIRHDAGPGASPERPKPRSRQRPPHTEPSSARRAEKQAAPRPKAARGTRAAAAKAAPAKEGAPRKTAAAKAAVPRKQAAKATRKATGRAR